MRTLTDRVFARYGIDATLETANGSVPVKVFFQSFNSKSWQSAERPQHPIGWIPKGQYVCLFPAGTAVTVGDYVTVNKVNYLVRRVEDMLDAAGPVYRWALCAMRGSEDTWG